MLRNTFRRDILTLVIVSIIVGSLLSATVAYSANAYFSKTLASLVGDYGEYDIIIQAREEVKDDTGVQIQKIINDAFPGGRMKEGPTITGKTTFFVALPDQYKTQQVYENLGKTFGSIPGGAGVGVVTEPRLTIRGVPQGARNMLIERIMQIDGVRFAFHDGAAIGIIMTSLDKSSYVNDQIKAILDQYQVIEISFPVGSEPANPIRMGDSIAEDMKSQLKLIEAKNVSVDGKNDDMTAAVSTMMEMRRFFQAYQTQVVITPNEGKRFIKGDKLTMLNGVVMEVTEIRSDGIAEAVVTKGDITASADNAVYQGLENNTQPIASGTAQYRSPRQQLGNALNDTAKLVNQIPGMSQDAQNMSKTALNVLDNYNNSINAIEQTLTGIDAAGHTLQTATSGLSNLDTGALQSQLDNSSRALGGMAGTFQVVKLVDPSAGAAAANLAAAQQNIDTLRGGLVGLSNVAANARQAKQAIDNVVANGYKTTNTLRSFDLNGTRSSLTDMNNRLAQLSQINAPVVAAQIQYLATAVPNLKDDDINSTLKILNQFIGGQVIPGERIQILTTSVIGIEAVTPIVYNQVGHKNVALYSTAMGVVEPNPRGELFKVITEVRAVLAGITAIVMTIAFLALDHSAVMASIRRKRLYGMAMGAVMLTAMFLLGGGGIPYLSWVGVPVLGAVFGLIIAQYAEKISPVAYEEVMAGKAVGLSFDEIMREIVIPSARPGLLQKLNRRKMQFR